MLPADRQRKIEKRFQKSLEAMPLDQLRKAQEMTQLQLAEILGVNHGEVSKIEHRYDICVGTLAEYVEAMGGRLEIRAVLKDREVRIMQFEELARERRAAETGTFVLGIIASWGRQGWDVAVDPL